MKSYAITTPIYYIYAQPHLGTAYTTVIADVLARFHRSLGQDVFFLTGTDENGERIQRAAQGLGKSPRELVDDMSEVYKAAWRGLSISYDQFIRTTEECHVRAVEEVFRRLQANGDIYKDRYEGWYCIYDETFVLEAPDGLCPECQRPVERAERDAYFFALSRYGDRLLDLYQSQPDFVTPSTRRNEVVRFIQDGLRDMCISRTNNGWGIPIPGDPDHVVYVWFDALINYLAACGFPDDRQRLDRLWPVDLHVVGKDILVRFHATLWPAMLMGAGVPLPRQILGHGHWLINKQKMSRRAIEDQLAQLRQQEDKSFTVTSLHPSDLVHSLQQAASIPEDRRLIAVDAVRYYLVRELPPGPDAEFSLDRLEERYNAELGNDLGNLLNRTLSMLQRYRDGRVPEPARGPLAEAAEKAVTEAARAYESLQPDEALASAWRLISAGNHFIAEQQPWNLYKAGEQVELDGVLYGCGEACRIAAVIAAPVMPAAAAEICRQLGLSPGQETLAWDKTAWAGWPAGSRALAPEPIFPRIEARKANKQTAMSTPARVGAAPNAGGSAPTPSNLASKDSTPGVTVPAPGSDTATVLPRADEVSIEEFGRLRFRIATVLRVEKVEGARKLLRLVLDLGDEQRQIVSGIAEQYTPEELVGRQIAVIVNLKPATIRGVQSFGMLLAADVGGAAVLLQPDHPVPPGSPVK